MLGSLDIGPLTAADIHGPQWLGTVAGGVFIVAGLAVIAGPSSIISDIFALLTIAGLAAIGIWIGFGEGTRVCSSSISLLGVGQSGESGDLACRIPFGYGALVVMAMLILMLTLILQKLAGGKPRLVSAVKIAEWILIISLSPLLLLMVTVLICSELIKALKTRCVTGAWPRYESFIKRRKNKLSKQRLSGNK